MLGYINKIYGFVIIAFLMIVGLSTSVSAQSSTFIQFQGKITNSANGTNLVSNVAPCINDSGADTCDFRINLYDSITAGTLLFQETHLNVEIGDSFGIFNIEINSICDSWVALGSPPTNCTASPTVAGIDWETQPDVYIELEFDDDGNGDFVSSEIFTRKIYSYTPFALYTNSATNINGFESDDFVQIQPGSAQEITSGSSNALISINETGTSDPAFIHFQQGGTSVFYIDNDGSVSIGSADSDGFLDLGAATTSSAQLNLSSSGAVDPSSPVAGDLWFDGTNFKFFDGSSTIELGVSAAGFFTDDTGVTYLTSTTDDFAIGGSDIANSIFGIDVSLGDYYFGSSQSVDPEFIFENSSSDTGLFAYNSNDAFEFNNSTNTVKVGVKNSTPSAELDVNGSIGLTGSILPTTASTSNIGSALKAFANIYVYAVNPPTGSPITFGNGAKAEGDILALPPVVSTGYETTVLSTDDVGMWMDMAINLDGVPVLAYRDETNTRVGVTVCGNVDCSSGNITTFYSSSGNDGDEGVSVAINKDNIPLITYYESVEGDWNVISCSNSNCTAATLVAIDTITAGQYSDIVVGRDGFPVMFSQHGPDDRLESRVCITVTCSAFGATAAILDDSAANVGVTPEAILSPAGNIVVAYHDETNGSLKFARCSNTACTTANVSTILTGTDMGEWLDIAIGREGFPIIAHQDGSNGDLYLTVCKNAACATYDNIPINASSDAIGSEGIGLSTKIDGSPVISYYNSTRGSLNVYECSNPLCTSGKNNEIVTDTDDKGQYSSIIRIPGTVETFVISYYDVDDGDIQLYYFDKTFTGGSSLGTSTNYFSALYTSNLYSKSATISNFDVAEEYIAADPSLEAGDIVKFSDSGEKDILNIVKASSPYDKDVIGVISTEPGLYLKNLEQEKLDGRPVALVGRVPVKVTDWNGPIKRGDYIVAGNIPGYGMKATAGGTIIGRAMEDFNPNKLNEGDSSMVTDYLKNSRDEAYTLIEEYESKIVSEILSEEEIQGYEAKIKEYQDQIDSLIDKIDQRNDFEMSTGRIMMFVNLTEIEDEAFENAVNIYDAFDDKSDINSISDLNSFIELSSNNLTISASEIILETDFTIEGDLYINGILSANVAEFDNLTSNENLFLPDKKKGSFTLQANTDSLFVENIFVTQQSKIFITTKRAGIQVAVTDKKDGKGFTVKSNKPLDEDFIVQYFIAD